MQSSLRWPGARKPLQPHVWPIDTEGAGRGVVQEPRLRSGSLSTAGSVLTLRD